MGFVSPTPLLLVVALADHLSVADLAGASEPAAAWFRQHRGAA